MTTLSSGNLSLFWTRLDEIRELLTGDETPAAQALFTSLQGMGHDLPPALVARRHEILARFAETYGLVLPAPERGNPAADRSPVPLEAFLSGRLSGISLVTCCMNRNNNLLRALPSWIARKELDEIVIVDWSSTPPVADDLDAAGVHDHRIRVVRIEGELRWILSYAFNLGFRLARFDRVLKADADIVLAPDFFTLNPLRKGQFIAGNWRRARAGQSFVNGFFYVHHEPLMSVKGFNEHITTYGWDDDELYERLTETAGLDRIDVVDGTIDHLDHDDEARIDEAPEETTNGGDDLARLPMHKIRTNRFISTIMPRWDGNRHLLPFDVLHCGGGTLVLHRRGWVPHPVPSHVVETARRLATYELVSWRAGLRTWELDWERLDAILRGRRLNDIQPLHVELALAGASIEIVTAPRHLVASAMQYHPSRLEAIQAAAAASGRTLVLYGPEMDYPENLRSQIGVLPGWINPGDLPITRKMPDPEDPRSVLALAEESPAAPAAPAVRTGAGRIFIDAQHGLGNRLRAIGSAGAIARAEGRALVVVWQPDHHCRARLADLFDYPGAVIETAFPEAARQDGATVLNYMEIEPGAAKGAPLRLEPGRDAYLRSAYVIDHPASTWEAENAVLRALVPAAPVRALVARVPPEHSDIGLHIRMEGMPGTDTNSYDRAENWTAEGHAEIHRWRSASHWSRFLDRAARELERRPEARMFLAADMAQTYAAVRDRFGDRVAMLEREVWDRSADQLHHALADMLCLARCRLLLGSGWSSFTEGALRLGAGAQGHEIAGRDF